MLSTTTTLLASLALLSSSLAIQVTQPASGDSTVLAIGGTSGAQTVSWSSVSTDPTSFALAFVETNNANKLTIVNSNVSTSAGSVSVTLPSGNWPTGTGYRFNLVQSTSNTNTILAQSGLFNITASTSAASTSSASSAASTSSASSATAQATSNTLMGTSTPSATSTGSASLAGNSNGAIPSQSSGSSAAGKMARIGALPAVAGLITLVGVAAATLLL